MALARDTQLHEDAHRYANRKQRDAVCVPADSGHESAGQRRLPLSARWPAATEPRHQGNARTGRRGSEHGMKLLLGGPEGA